MLDNTATPFLLLQKRIEIGPNCLGMPAKTGEVVPVNLSDQNLIFSGSCSRVGALLFAEQEKIQIFSHCIERDQEGSH